jgi:hypothetical protein
MQVKIMHQAKFHYRGIDVIGEREIGTRQRQTDMTAIRAAFQERHGVSPEEWVMDRVRRGLDRAKSIRLWRDLGRQALAECRECSE